MNTFSTPRFFKAANALIFLFVVFFSANSAGSYVDNWQETSNQSFDENTNSSDPNYIRSHTSYDPSTSSFSDVIEMYKIGNDGYVYVQVVENGVFKGSFRYTNSYANSGDPFSPPGGSDWYNNNNDYTGIAAVPEPEEWAMLMVGALMVAWQIRRKYELGIAKQGL